jgi:hypothetical protein
MEPAPSRRSHQAVTGRRRDGLGDVTEQAKDAYTDLGLALTEFLTGPITPARVRRLGREVATRGPALGHLALWQRDALQDAISDALDKLTDQLESAPSSLVGSIAATTKRLTKLAQKLGDGLPA